MSGIFHAGNCCAKPCSTCGIDNQYQQYPQDDATVTISGCSENTICSAAAMNYTFNSFYESTNSCYWLWIGDDTITYPEPDAIISNPALYILWHKDNKIWSALLILGWRTTPTPTYDFSFGDNTDAIEEISGLRCNCATNKLTGSFTLTGSHYSGSYWTPPNPEFDCLGCTASISI